MKTISIGRVGCDIIIPDSSVSRKHATISLVNGQYVYQDISRNGTAINGRVYQNEKVIVAPGTPIYLANKVPLPWPQILILLPNSPICMNGLQANTDAETYAAPVHHAVQESVGIVWGVGAFLFPILGFILYFVWRESSEAKAKQVASIAWTGVAVNVILGILSAL